MLIPHVHSALKQVQELRQRIIEKQSFSGYSGVSRILGGFVALLGGLLMLLPVYPPTPIAHLIGWGLICFVSVLLNYSAMLFWYLKLPDEDRQLISSSPIIDPMAPLLVGGLFTISMLMHGAADYLFGMWMCLFGLTNLSPRHFLSKEISFVGLFYILCGTWCLFLWSKPDFLNPVPMMSVFFIGELVGGLVFFKHRRGNFQ